MNNKLTYTRCGDYYIPYLTLSESESKPLGKYGRMRKNYLKEHRPVLWNIMILAETIYPHLREIDEIANRRLEQLVSTLLTSAPAPDKEIQQMAWVRPHIQHGHLQRCAANHGGEIPDFALGVGDGTFLGCVEVKHSV